MSVNPIGPQESRRHIGGLPIEEAQAALGGGNLCPQDGTRECCIGWRPLLDADAVPTLYGPNIRCRRLEVVTGQRLAREAYQRLKPFPFAADHVGHHHRFTRQPGERSPVDLDCCILNFSQGEGHVAAGAVKDRLPVSQPGACKALRVPEAIGAKPLDDLA